MSKTWQGHRTKLNKKRQKRRKSVVVGRQQPYCAVQLQLHHHRRTTTEKVQSSVLDWTSSAMVHSWQMTAGCSMHMPKPLWRHCRQALSIWWRVSPAWLYQQNADGVECRYQMFREPFSEVIWRFSVKVVVGQNAQPEFDPFQNSQLMELTEKQGYAFWSPRWVNQSGSNIEDGLQMVLQLARYTSENQVAVVHLANNQCINQSSVNVIY